MASRENNIMSSSCACIQPQSKQNFLKKTFGCCPISGTRCWLTSSGFIWRRRPLHPYPGKIQKGPLF